MEDSKKKGCEGWNATHATKKIAGLLLVAMMIGLIAGCSQAPDTTGAKAADTKIYKWRLVTHQLPGTARYDTTILPFVEAVKAASGGRLIIEPYGAGVLFPVSETLDNVKNGVVEIAAIWSGYWAGKNPVFALAASIPADPINSFSEHYYKMDKLTPLISRVYEANGVKSLGGFDFGPSEILMSNKPLSKLSDFKGITIRTAGIGGEFYAAIGASTVSLAAPEIYQGLQLGTVDAAEFNDWVVNSEMGLNEVTKYVIEPVLHTGPTDDKTLIVNPKAWSELPDDLKAIVLSARDGAMATSARAYAAKSIASKNKYIAAGTKILTLPAADVATARSVASELLKTYAKKNNDCAEFIKTYAEALRDLGYEKEAQALE
jgi:TRAP-type mannitol/chloroaromatic compound transport system substrate-binding protein